MRTPATRERVRVEGRDGLFLVVWVDVELQIADVIPLVQGDAVFSVPFTEIRPLHDAQAPRNID
ncbi:MAG TPA: hypothetical protein VGL22_08720 [Terracidiphilus sp.]